MGSPYKNMRAGNANIPVSRVKEQMRSRRVAIAALADGTFSSKFENCLPAPFLGNTAMLPVWMAGREKRT
jgi:hypothetical protein